jgi:hypothetical protein
MSWRSLMNFEDGENDFPAQRFGPLVAETPDRDRLRRAWSKVRLDRIGPPRWAARATVIALSLAAVVLARSRGARFVPTACAGVSADHPGKTGYTIAKCRGCRGRILVLPNIGYAPGDIVVNLCERCSEVARDVVAGVITRREEDE